MRGRAHLAVTALLAAGCVEVKDQPPSPVRWTGDVEQILASCGECHDAALPSEHRELLRRDRLPRRRRALDPTREREEPVAPRARTAGPRGPARARGARTADAMDHGERRGLRERRRAHGRVRVAEVGGLPRRSAAQRRGEGLRQVPRRDRRARRGRGVRELPPSRSRGRTLRRMPRRERRSAPTREDL